MITKFQILYSVTLLYSMIYSMMTNDPNKMEKRKKTNKLIDFFKKIKE